MLCYEFPCLVLAGNKQVHAASRCMCCGSLSSPLWAARGGRGVRPQGLEGVARLRVSTGLDVGKYGGPFHRRTADDIELPALNADQVSCHSACLRGAPFSMTRQGRCRQLRPAVGMRVYTCRAVGHTAAVSAKPPSSPARGSDLLPLPGSFLPLNCPGSQRPGQSALAEHRSYQRSNKQSRHRAAGRASNNEAHKGIPITIIIIINMISMRSMFRRLCCCSC